MAAAGRPQLLGNRERAELVLQPPGLFIPSGMDLAMVKVAKGDGEFVTDLAT